jgi:ADP-ribose pyrophosphatase YjhB (NUDIX family)
MKDRPPPAASLLRGEPAPIVGFRDVWSFEMPDPTYEPKFGTGPHLTADAVVLRGEEIALVHRRKDGVWALPGGFLDPGETFQACALREFKEEAGIDLVAGELIQSIERPVAFDAPDRDPRSRIISGAVLIRISRADKRPGLIAGDDADDARWFNRHQLPELYADHREIIEALLPRQRV